MAADPAIKASQMKRKCKYCGKGPYTWYETPQGWRLYESPDTPHECKDYLEKVNHQAAQKAKAKLFEPFDERRLDSLSVQDLEYAARHMVRFVNFVADGSVHGRVEAVENRAKDVLKKLNGMKS